MTITTAITMLERLRDKHGDVDVFFDCPNCHSSFAPDIVKPVAAHLSAKWQDASKLPKDKR